MLVQIFLWQSAGTWQSFVTRISELTVGEQDYLLTFFTSFWIKISLQTSLGSSRTLLEIYPLKPLYTFRKQYCPSPTLRVSQLIYKITILWKFRLNRTSESGENNGKTHSCFRAFRRVMTCVYNKSVILANENLYCFTVFSKSKAFHGLIFQEKSFTITFCKPCKLFVNLWTFSFLFLYRKGL